MKTTTCDIKRTQIQVAAEIAIILLKDDPRPNESDILDACNKALQTVNPIEDVTDIVLSKLCPENP